MKLTVVAAFCLISTAFCQTGNIVDVAKQLGATTLLELATDAGLAGVLSTGGPFTVFAPTNEAFSALPPRVLNMLKKNKQLLADVLKYHVLNGKVYSSQLSNELVTPTLLEGFKDRINIYQGGKVVTSEGSPVVKVDQNATNGVIHVISKVELPPRGTVVDAAKRNNKLGTLVKAVVAAGLVETLSGAGPFTVFAPTDAAFNALPPGTLDNLLKNKTALTDVLTYHVVSGTFYSAGLASGAVPTVEGKSVNIAVASGGVTVNDAKVTMADESVTNGVIHVIDKVLIPPK
ncbi:hypothetical protein FSP39_003850 [Pinctada imbricata]|uniref:FAS1 domain-containing protein n=1 Tax=Pinctada imbricata TaxID=66713 RepID=A0AA88YGV2_PINIB|nr:hypothetical protein FSP39_003850 [Pinctada imbricata]